MNAGRAALDLPRPVRTPLIESGDPLLRFEAAPVTGSAHSRRADAKVAQAAYVLASSRRGKNTLAQAPD